MAAYPSIILRLPKLDEEDEFLRAHRATSPGFPSFLHFYQEGMAFADYLERLGRVDRGLHLPGPDSVPATFLFAFVDGRIVGRASIRHRLSPQLERVGGHIGYAVVPEFRRRGYATAILRESLAIARDRIGLARVLLTCDDDNVPSIRTIERNGGVVQDVVSDLELERPKRRYWIELAPRAG